MGLPQIPFISISLETTSHQGPGTSFRRFKKRNLPTRRRHATKAHPRQAQPQTRHRAGRRRRLHPLPPQACAREEFGAEGGIRTRPEVVISPAKPLFFSICIRARAQSPLPREPAWAARAPSAAAPLCRSSAFTTASKPSCLNFISLISRN